VKPGELYISTTGNIWEHPIEVVPNYLVGWLTPGDLLLILEVRERETKILSPRGEIGWIGGFGPITRLNPL